jgi:hypothetical protein
MMNQKKEKIERYQVDVVDSLVEEELAKAAPGVERAIIQSLDEEREDMDEETNLNVRWL